MSDYRCNRCNGFGITCTCYRHYQTQAESAARDKVSIVRSQAEQLFSEYLQGYSYGKNYERIPVTELDMHQMDLLKTQYIYLESIAEQVHKDEYAKGLARQQKRPSSPNS